MVAIADGGDEFEICGAYKATWLRASTSCSRPRDEPRPESYKLQQGTGMDSGVPPYSLPTGR
jgi:hypothetical protein